MSAQPQTYREVKKDTDPYPALELFFGLSPTAVIWGSAVWLVGWLILY